MNLMAEELTKGELSNGFKYFIIENQIPQDFISLRLKVNVGSLAEETGEEGLAHFLEHMAFNGTEKYKGEKLIALLKTLGISSSHGLNAHTGFNETVFKLDGNKENLDIFLDIMLQWAYHMTFDPYEIEKEKGVVIEEWRQETNLNSKKSNFYRKSLYKDSRYLERFPIGKVDSIKKFTPELVENFYRKWYLPNNIELYIVGDVDKGYLKDRIESLFSEQNPAPLDFKPEWRERKLKAGINFDSFNNEELDKNTLSIFNIHKTSKNDRVKVSVMENLFNIIFNKRFNQKFYNNELLLKGISISQENLNKDTSFTEVFMNLDKDSPEKSMENAFAHLEQLKKGITPEEFLLSKNLLKENLEYQLENIRNIDTKTLMEKLLEYPLDRDEYQSYEEFYMEALEKSDHSTLEEINAFIKEILSSSEVHFLYSGYKELDPLEIKKAADAGMGIDLGNFKLSQSVGNPYTKKITDGKIIQEIYNEEFGYILLKLSNGSNVYLYQTNYKENQISFTALSKGGSNYLQTKDLKKIDLLHSVSYSGPGSILNYKEYLIDKNFNLNFSLNKYTESFKGTSDKNSIEDLLANFYGFITEPKVDDGVLDMLKNSSADSILTEENLKAHAFFKEYNKRISGNSQRNSQLDLRELESIQSEDLLKIFKDRFDTDYDYYFIGDFDYEEIKGLIEHYIASLPVRAKENYKVISEEILDGKDSFTMNLGTGEESSVFLRYGGRSNLDSNSGYYKVISNIILEAELSKVLREDLGGIYSIEIKSTIDSHMPDRAYIDINFFTDPDRVEEMIEATDKVINNIISGNISPEIIEYIKSIYSQQFESELHTGDYYSDLFTRLIYGEKEKLIPQEFNNLLKVEDIISYMKWIYGGYKGTFVLNPQN